MQRERSGKRSGAGRKSGGAEPPEPVAGVAKTTIRWSGSGAQSGSLEVAEPPEPEVGNGEESGLNRPLTACSSPTFH